MSWPDSWEKVEQYLFARAPFIDCSQNDPRMNRDLIIALSRKNIPPAIVESIPTKILHVDLVGRRTHWKHCWLHESGMEKEELAKLFPDKQQRTNFLVGAHALFILRGMQMVVSSAKVLEYCTKFNQNDNDRLAYEVATRPV